MQQFKSFLILSLLLLQSHNSFSQLFHYEIAANFTDSNIDLDIRKGETLQHQIFIDTSKQLKNKLLVFLPGTGGVPSEHYSEFCKTAAHQGYHAIGLVYNNTVSISKTCGTSATKDNYCSENLRMEIIYGKNLSDHIQVNQANGIVNRLFKLITYLNGRFPNQGWDQYLKSSGSNLNWEKITLAGHSQGGGHAALIARDSVLHRVIFFNCPSDVNKNIPTPLNQPTWFYDNHITPDSSYYAFYHQQNGGDERLKIYKLFGLGQFGMTQNIDIESVRNHGSHILYTDVNTFDYNSFINRTCDTVPPINNTFNPHSDIIVDCEIPLNGMGNNPYENIWIYMLINNTYDPILHVKNMNNKPNISINPNPIRDNFQLLNVQVDKLSIYSASGSFVQSFSRASSYDISHLRVGIYFIQIQTDNRIYLKKIIKQ